MSREQFTFGLKRKDKTIDELQEKNEILNKQIKVLTEEKDTAISEKILQKRKKHALEQMIASKKCI